MTKYLFTFSADYADEFDVEGFSIGTEEDKQKYDYVKDNLDKLDDDTYYVGFGSNEEIEFENVSEFLEYIEPEEITDEEYNTIKKVFGTEYGLVYPLSHLTDLYSDITVDYSKE